MSLIREFKSIVMTSRAPAATAAFYRDVLGLPLEEEQHRGTARHWACRVGSLHFAIHDLASFWLGAPAQGEATIASFTVDELEPLAQRLSARGVEIIARTHIGPMAFAAARDPDGRAVCFGTPWPTRGARSRG